MSRCETAPDLHPASCAVILTRINGVSNLQAGARLAEELQAAESGAADLHSRLDAARREAEKNREAVRSAVHRAEHHPNCYVCSPGPASRQGDQSTA